MRHARRMLQIASPSWRRGSCAPIIIQYLQRVLVKDILWDTTLSRRLMVDFQLQVICVQIRRYITSFLRAISWMPVIYLTRRNLQIWRNWTWNFESNYVTAYLHPNLSFYLYIISDTSGGKRRISQLYWLQSEAKAIKVFINVLFPFSLCMYFYANSSIFDKILRLRELDNLTQSFLINVGFTLFLRCIDTSSS